MIELILYTAAPLAFLVSLGLLWIYLRAVKQAMRSQSSPGAGAPVTVTAEARSAPAGVPPRFPLAVGSHDAPDATARPKGPSPWAFAAVHAAAGLVYGFIMAVTWLTAGSMGFDWLVASYFALFFGWPIVIAIGLAATRTWVEMAVAVLSYVVVVAGAGVYMAWGTAITVPQFVTIWLNTNAAATAVALAFLARPIRAAGPLVAAMVLICLTGSYAVVALLGAREDVQLAFAWIGTVLHLGSYGTVALVLLTGALAAGVLGWPLLRLLGWLYRTGRVSEQSIMIDAVWLIFAALQSPIGWLPAGLGAFLAYKAVSLAGFRLLRPPVERDAHAPRLLLLRVFSLGRRSEQLFDGLARRWRYRGSIRMIAGPDLATSTVEPHEFLDFLAGRLKQRFITGPEALDRRLVEATPRRDLDGRFRVTSFFCHDDTWRTTLRRLARDSDAVLMDLRGFSPANRGCIFEIDALLDLVPLARVVFVVDGSTDEAFLDESLAAGWAAISSGSPNRDDPAPRARLFQLSARAEQDVAALVSAVAGAAGLRTAYLAVGAAPSSAAPG